MLAVRVSIGRCVVTEFFVINGHAPWCAYIQTLADICVDEEPCDCHGWDEDDREDDAFWDDPDEVWS